MMYPFTDYFKFDMVLYSRTLVARTYRQNERSVVRHKISKVVHLFTILSRLGMIVLEVKHRTASYS